MLKSYFGIVLIFSCLALIASDNNCGTPVECYAKAIAILTQDRAEMRKEADLLKTQIAEMKKEADLLKTEIANTINTKLEELNKKIETNNSSTISNTNSINDLRSQVNNLFGRECSVVTKWPSNAQECGQGICPAGRREHGGGFDGKADICTKLCCNY